MIKKICADQLTVGMYIHDLNCSWMTHGFLRRQFSMKSQSVLEQVRRCGVRELYIDTDKGLDVPPAPPANQVPETAPVTDRRLVAGAAGLASERVRAKRIHQEAITIVAGLMEDVRMGRQIELERTRSVVSEMLGSICRNQSALMGLARIRRMDRYTFEHSVNVSVLMVSFARSLGFNQTVIEEVGIGALLHDMGKTLVPLSILNKPGPLTKEEYAVMRDHVAQGRETLSHIPGISSTALAVTAEHHERADGNGYPHGKRIDEITLFGRMAAIVDVYDAITSDRVYHKGVDPHRALRRLLESSGHHFDPQLVQQFIRCVGIYPVGTLVMLESGRLGVVMEAAREGCSEPVVRIVMDAKQRRFLPIQDLDLARQGRGKRDKILSAEPPQEWGIDLEEILQLPI